MKRHCVFENQLVEKIRCEWLGENDPNADFVDLNSCVNVIILPFWNDLDRYESENGIGAETMFHM